MTYDDITDLRDALTFALLDHQVPCADPVRHPTRVMVEDLPDDALLMIEARDVHTTPSGRFTVAIGRLSYPNGTEGQFRVCVPRGDWEKLARRMASKLWVHLKVREDRLAA